jgi:RNA recognition motif-containing protein
VIKTLYIGNLQWNTSDEELKEFFSSIGNVESVKIVKDNETGRSKGYGFVKMENADEAMEKLDGKELRGRPLKINPSRNNR